LAERIALIDYGAGNLQSVANALKASGSQGLTITADPELVRTADRIILPGVGAFAAGMAGLQAVPGLIAAMTEAVTVKARPFLGICVGMQLLADTGEEYGAHAGLGWISGVVRKLSPADRAARVPHMGWNDVTLTRPHPMLSAGEAYFLHSFAFHAANPAELIATTDHAGPVTAAVARETILGVQFHPEKSQAYGLTLLRKFLEWKP
jgi:imidazole glycerol-phosphate synthase subunit HisH